MSSYLPPSAVTARSRAPATARGAPDRRLDPALPARLVGRAVAAPDAERFTITAPFTGEVVASVPTSTPDDVIRAVDRARAVQPGWALRTPRERALVLLRLHDLVLRRQDEVLDLVQTESGKSRAHAYEEVADVAINARWYARRGPHLLRDEPHPGLVPGLTRVREVHHAKGVVGIVAPWNFPLTLAVSDALPALLAGNAVVLKPDSQTPLTALWAAELLAEAGLPDGLFQVVVGEGAVVGTALVDTCDYVAFTGSTATGRLVAQRAGARLVGVSLELGGKNGLYVAEDAHLHRAAEAAVRDCFASAGQLCVSMERMLLHEHVADRFLDIFLDRVRRLRLGAGLSYDYDVGSLVSQVQLDRVRRHVDDALGRGARLLAGGRHRPDLGPLFYEPTVLANVPDDAACQQEETFGPLVVVTTVATDAEAVARTNATGYGLNASVWTKDLRRGAHLARRLQTGTVSVNETYAATWGSVAAPMGGRKLSGLGRRHGSAGLLRYTESQTIAVQRVGLGPLFSHGGRRLSVVFTTALRGARRAHLPWP